MMQYVAVFAFFIIGFAFMALMLHFSQYRKRKSTCCSDVLEEFEKGENCDTCPNKDSDECAIRDMPQTSDSIPLQKV